MIQPDRDVRPFQDVLLDLGARLKLPGMIDGHGKALYPGGLKDYMVWHERRPGIGMLAGWRGHEEDKQGMGEPNRRQLDRYIENGCFWRGEIPEKARFYRFANRDFFDWAIPRGFLDKPQQIVLQLYSEPLRKFQLAAEGHGTRQPPEHLRARVEPRLRSAAELVSAVRRGGGQRRLPAARDHPAPDAHVSFLGLRRMPGCGRSRRAIRCSSRASSASASASPTATGCGSKARTAR